MDNTQSTDELEKRLKWYETKYGPYIETRGIHNWKNLFKKPTMNDWMTLIMLIMAIALGLAYQADHNMCVKAINFWNQAHSPIGPGTTTYPLWASNLSFGNNTEVINGEGG